MLLGTNIFGLKKAFPVDSQNDILVDKFLERSCEESGCDSGFHPRTFLPPKMVFLHSIAALFFHSSSPTVFENVRCQIC